MYHFVFSQVTWLSSGGEGGFCLEYPKICLHAISRDVTSFPHECVFLQIDGKLIGTAICYLAVYAN